MGLAKDTKVEFHGDHFKVVLRYRSTHYGDRHVLTVVKTRCGEDGEMAFPEGMSSHWNRELIGLLVAAEKWCELHCEPYMFTPVNELPKQFGWLFPAGKHFDLKFNEVPPSCKWLQAGV